MASEFDQIISRSGTSSSKYDKYSDSDVIPLWVADMDFAAPGPVLDALHRRVDHGVFGYTEPPEELIQVVINRLASLYGWQVTAEDLVFLPGVVPGLNLACRTFAEPSASIVTATPVYGPFLQAAENAGRKSVEVKCHYQKGVWRYPTVALTEALDQNAGVMLLCHPHNPIGRCLTSDELVPVIQACIDQHVVLVSDEIHCELLLDGRQHRPAATLCDGAEQVTVTLMAASKTFNLAGLGGCFAVIQNPGLRQRFIQKQRGIMADVNALAFEAMLAAYRDCHNWHQDLLNYLQGNRDYLYQALNSLPGIRMNQVEATYLAWLDVSALDLDDPPTFFESAGLGLSEGFRFGDPDFMRLNFACPRSVLVNAVERLSRVLT